jgi:hypothetical protein
MSDSLSKRLELKRWLRERLTEGDRPRAEWRKLWEASWHQLLRTPVDELFDVDAARALADQLADSEILVEATRPVVAKIVRAVIAELREDGQPIGRLVPDEARERLKVILAQPGLVHPDWVRATLRGEAVEGVLNDALYRTLKDFSTLFPRMLVRIATASRLGILGGAVERLITEVEKLIEPEIRSFLADGTGRLLESAVELTISKIDDPAQIEFRATLFEFVLSRSPEFLLASADEALIDDLGDAVEITTRHLIEAPETREAVHAWIDRIMDACADQTLGEALELDDPPPDYPIDAMAEVTWPAWQSVTASPEAKGWLDDLVDELLDVYEDDGSA